jgi:hypothetical protein
MEDAKKNTNARPILNLPESADAVTMLRAIIAQKRASADSSSESLNRQEGEIAQARAEIEAQRTYIDDLERDADRLDAINHGVPVGTKNA